MLLPVKMGHLLLQRASQLWRVPEVLQDRMLSLSLMTSSLLVRIVRTFVDPC